MEFFKTFLMVFGAIYLFRIIMGKFQAKTANNVPMVKNVETGQMQLAPSVSFLDKLIPQKPFK
jgi:hypothetical protein